MVKTRVYSAFAVSLEAVRLLIRVSCSVSSRSEGSESESARAKVRRRRAVVLERVLECDEEECDVLEGGVGILNEGGGLMGLGGWMGMAPVEMEGDRWLEDPEERAAWFDGPSTDPI
jgi:hypothetical protein